MYLQSAETGFLSSQKRLIDIYDKKSNLSAHVDMFKACYWTGRYVGNGGVIPKFAQMVDGIIEGRIVDTETRPRLLFELGKALVLFRGPRYRFDQMAEKDELETISYVTSVFEQSIANAEHVIMLVACAMRFRMGVPKDMVRMIGKKMWLSRFEFGWFREDFLAEREDSDKKCIIM